MTISDNAFKGERAHNFLMTNPIEETVPARRRRVLVVEDDVVNRAFLRMALQKDGCTVIPVESVAAAQEQLEAGGFEAFDCVVSDYWMPEQTGLDLVDWLREKDSCLASILVTAEGEKGLIAESFRRGVLDFLEKPVNVPKLLAAVNSAVAQTQAQRNQSQSASAVKNLGRTQMWMVQSSNQVPGKLFCDVCFHPKLEAGGDFLGHFQISPEQHCCLLTDVSGHDLRAAYISAYFHGIFRGMLMRRAPLADIFKYFNEFLLQEWNQRDQQSASNAFGTSIAAAALMIDTQQQVANVFICGAPVPIYVSPDGRAQAMGENGGPPLGWFPQVDSRAAIYAINGGGTIFLWTDGLADLAEAQAVHPLSLAFALQQAKEKSLRLPLLEHANDDILFAAVHLPSVHVGDELPQPITMENYRGNQIGDIDTLAAGWRRNLKLAVADLSESAEHDILLASREAVLNAMEHGCQEQADKNVRFQMSYNARQQAVRIWVEDPGTGHPYDFPTFTHRTNDELIDEHRGLLFINNLAQNVKFERNGATIIMDFAATAQTEYQL